VVFAGSCAQRPLRVDEEAPLKDQKITFVRQGVSNLEKENDLMKQQNTTQEKLTEPTEREADIYRVAFEKEKNSPTMAIFHQELSLFWLPPEVL